MEVGNEEVGRKIRVVVFSPVCELIGHMLGHHQQGPNQHPPSLQSHNASRHKIYHKDQTVEEREKGEV